VIYLRGGCIKRRDFKRRTKYAKEGSGRDRRRISEVEEKEVSARRDVRLFPFRRRRREHF